MAMAEDVRVALMVAMHAGGDGEDDNDTGDECWRRRWWRKPTTISCLCLVACHRPRDCRDPTRTHQHMCASCGAPRRSAADLAAIINLAHSVGAASHAAPAAPAAGPPHALQVSRNCRRQHTLPICLGLRHTYKPY